MYPGCVTQIPVSADHDFFFIFFQPEGHFFPPLTPLWHIPMRKFRHHKAAIGEMETLRPGTAFMFFVGQFDKGSQRFFRVLWHVGACSPFCECQNIRNVAYKSGESSGNLNQDCSFKAPTRKV